MLLCGASWRSAAGCHGNRGPNVQLTRLALVRTRDKAKVHARCRRHDGQVIQPGLAEAESKQWLASTLATGLTTAAAWLTITRARSAAEKGAHEWRKRAARDTTTCGTGP